MSGAVDHATLVAKRYSENLCLLEFRPDRIRETSVRCREYLVVSVFPVGVEPHPLAGPFDQPDLPRAVVLVVGLDIDGDDPQGTARGHDHVETVVGDCDPDSRQCNHHVVGHGEELPLHPNLDVDDRDDRPEVRMRPEEFVRLRLLADGDRHDADGASAFNTWEIATKLLKFALVFVEFFRNNGQLRLCIFVCHDWLLFDLDFCLPLSVASRRGWHLSRLWSGAACLFEFECRSV